MLSKDFKLIQKILALFFVAFMVAQIVKNMPAMQETQVRSLGQEDPLEKKMATHSSILAWRILWTEEPGGLQSMGSQSQIRLSNLMLSLFSVAPPVCRI